MTVSPNGARTFGGGAVGAGGSGTAAKFDVTGQAGLTYAIDTSATSATLTGGANSMAFTAVSDITASAITTGTVTTGTLTGGAQIDLRRRRAGGRRQPGGRHLHRQRRRWRSTTTDAAAQPASHADDGAAASGRMLSSLAMSLALLCAWRDAVRPAGRHPDADRAASISAASWPAPAAP